jgi:acetyl esterase/lipase
MDLDTTFLAVSTAGAVNTLNAWKPLTRRSRAAGLTFFPGWLTSELPLQTIGWQAAATAAFAAGGALRSSAGKAGLALSIASWAGLYGLHRVANQSSQVLEDALVEGLGADYRTRMAPTFAPPADAPITRREIARPFQPWRKRYATDRNLDYGGGKGRRSQLDIWKRADLPRDGKAPVLFQVHGGGWVIGNKEQQAGPLMAHLAERGWICATANDPLSPRATWPEHIVEVKRALAWVKQNIADHGGDPDFVVITGGSAGGHLCSLAALSANDPELQPGFEDADTSVVAAVPFYGVYDLTNRDGTGNAFMEDFLARVVLKAPMHERRDLWDQASTMSWVSPEAPPMFILHGTNDSLVPVEQARSFVAMMRAASRNEVVYAELPHTQHAFEVFASVRAMHAVRAVDRFLAVIRSEHGAPTAPTATDEPAALTD